MRLFVDLNTGKLVRSAADTRAVTRLTFVRGAASPVEIMFVRDGEGELLPEGDVIRFILKPEGEFDGDPVVFSDAFVAPEDATGYYLASPSFNTEELNALLFSPDEDPSNDVASVTLGGSISWGAAEVDPSKTLPFEVIVQNSYDNGAEGIPVAAMPNAIERIEALEASIGNDSQVNAADIADSSEAGRALLTAEDEAAQRVALGLGDVATQNAPEGIVKGAGGALSAAVAGTDYEAAQTAMSQAEAELGTGTSTRSVTPVRLWQATAGKFRDAQWCLVREDFCGGGNTDQQVGELGWRFAAVSGSTAYVLGQSNHPGIFKLTTAATTGAIGTLYLAGSGAAPILMADWNVVGGFAEFIFQIDATTSVKALVGLCNDTSAYPTRGAYLEFDTDSSDTNFMFVCRNSSVSTRTSSGVAASTGWHRVRIWRSGASEISFSLNGGAAIAITTNLPSGSSFIPRFSAEARSNAARAISADFAMVSFPVTR